MTYPSNTKTLVAILEKKVAETNVSRLCCDQQNDAVGFKMFSDELKLLRRELGEALVMEKLKL